jgi:hypothetical protein
MRTRADLSVPSEVSAQILSSARLAMLDRRFAVRTARRPEIHATLSLEARHRLRRPARQWLLRGELPAGLQALVARLG